MAETPAATDRTADGRRADAPEPGRPSESGRSPGLGRPPESGGLLPTELRAWMELLAAAGAIEQQLRGLVKERFGVTHDEFLVVCLLADQPDSTLRMSQIAELLGRPKTRLTYQVVCLQRAGLIARRAACGDRRGIEVTLTDKARQLLAEASPVLATAVTQALTNTLSCVQRQALQGLQPHLPDLPDLVPPPVPGRDDTI
jgi:DNA-binding MarR family transcriptional regulator